MGNSSQVIVHLGIKTYLNHFISECLPSPELLQPTALEAPSYQHDGYSPLSQPPTPEHSKLLLNERTLTLPLSSLCWSCNRWSSRIRSWYRFSIRIPHHWLRKKPIPQTTTFLIRHFGFRFV